MIRLLAGPGRAATVVVAVLAGVAVGSAPAGAHVPAPNVPDVAYYRTELLSITPVPPGVSVRVDPAGEWIELTNTSPVEVVVLGYSREPYLRVTATLAEENQLSPSKYINTALFVDAVPTAAPAAAPAGAGGAAAASWYGIGTTGTVRWHDHRIHWMGQARPPAVAADPRHQHLVGEWTVHALAGEVPFEVHGDLRWMGKPDGPVRQPIPEWLLALIEAVVVATAVATVITVRQRKQRSAAEGPKPPRPSGRRRWSVDLPEEGASGDGDIAEPAQPAGPEPSVAEHPTPVG